MFKKSFKVKCQTTLKCSGRKSLINRMKDKFPILTSDDLQVIFPKKDNVIEIKIITNTETLNIYTVQNVPLLFESQNRLFPSVFILWRYPSLVASVAMHDAIVEKLVNGADLMVPGLRGLFDYCGDFNQNDIVSVGVKGNKASLSVGVAAMSSQQIRTTNHGKAVIVLHNIGDELFKMIAHPPVKPNIFFEMNTNEINFEKANINQVLENNVHVLESSDIQDTNITITNNLNNDYDENTEKNINEIVDALQQCSMTTHDYDSILEKFFFISLLNLPKDSLPMLSNIFYKTKFLAALPEGTEFDIKKTSWKKLSVFLKNMADSQIITIEDVKGNQRLLSVSYSHPDFKEYTQFKSTTKPEQIHRKKIIIDEVYQVTKLAAEILHPHRNKTLISAGDVRKSVTAYAKSKELDKTSSKEHVLINDTLAQLFKIKTREITWKELYSHFFKLLKKVFFITLPSGQTLTKNSELPPIEIKVASRANKKKVTIVSNLANFGIDVKEFAHECQVAVAASTTIVELPGQQKDLQFQIQGNHSILIRNTLLDEYGVPTKYLVIIDPKDTKKK